jgi:hypothetical protein
MDFSLTEVTDALGVPLVLRTQSQDFFTVRDNAEGQSAFQEAVTSSPDSPRLSMFLTKNLLLTHPPRLGSLRRAMFLIHVSGWETSRNHPGASDTVLFLERIPWLETIVPIALGLKVSIVEVARSRRPQAIRNLLPRNLLVLLQLLHYRGIQGTVKIIWRRMFNNPTVSGAESSAGSSNASGVPLGAQNRIGAVEFVGQLHLNHPERHSNLFFWQQSSLAGSDLSVVFNSFRCQLDEQGRDELAEHGLSDVITYPGATTLADAPVFSGPRYQPQKPAHRPVLGRAGIESKWLQEQLSNYSRLRHYWEALFTEHNIGVFVTYDKLDGAHMAIADALESRGGITVNYERSYGTYACPDLAGSADVMFNFSQDSADLERRSGSSAKYHVVTGYLGDHRFSMLGNKSESVRDGLRSHGANHVLAFFDDTSSDDGRWSTGHQLTRENYTFLLEKLLSEPWFGLVIKPKIPVNLIRRLGPVADLLRKAESTGRCFVFWDGGHQGSYPPAAAALAADFAVHGHLWTGTAGVEAALSGIPTILMDREGWRDSSLYKLGIGKVVFTEWERLWDACLEHWARPGSLPGFGDWSSVLDELDPFRDGRAAERMGNYIQSLLTGLRAGQNRDMAMALAADQYREKWGYDKVIQGDNNQGSTPAVFKVAESNVV